jgi:hypothetical protein
MNWGTIVYTDKRFAGVRREHRLVGITAKDENHIDSQTAWIPLAEAKRLRRDLGRIIREIEAEIWMTNNAAKEGAK